MYDPHRHSERGNNAIWKSRLLLTLIVLLAPQIIVSTLFQHAAGVPFTTAEMVGPFSSFVVLGAIAAWLLADILRHV